MIDVAKFQRRVFPKHREKFKAMATAPQHPHTLFITCSDSRIDPAMITQTNPGELFICRVIGNIVPRCDVSDPGGITATIEYALGVLKVDRIIICGHSDCGVMKAILAGQDHIGPFKAVWSWAQHAAHPEFGETVPKLTERNVLEQVGNLLTHPLVRSRPGLKIDGWIYDIGSGVISEYSADQNKFTPLV